MGEPQCKDYLGEIAHFAKLYTGGEQMPLATFLVAFSKQFGESALLGEEFMKLLTHYDFKVSGNLLPCFRVAVLAAQLTSSKIVDKISKLLVKSDFDRLKTKCKAELQDAEKLLADSWSLVEKAKHLEELKRLHVFGRLCIRVVLFMCQKQKMGRESKAWKSLEDIRDQFASETNSQEAFQDLLQPDPVAVALLQNQHLEIGSNYQNPKVGSTICQLMEVTLAGAKFLGYFWAESFLFWGGANVSASPQLAQAFGPLRFEHVPLVGAADTLVVPLRDDLKDWRKSKKTMQILLAADIAEKQLVYKHPDIQESIQLHSTQVQFHKAFMTGPVNAKASGFVANPVGICALQHFAAGSLVLKPCGFLFPVKDQDKDKVKVMVGKFGVNAPKMISEFDKVDDKTVLVPFWYVKPTMDEELVNMQVEKKQFGSLGLPC